MDDSPISFSEGEKVIVHYFDDREDENITTGIITTITPEADIYVVWNRIVKTGKTMSRMEMVSMSFSYNTSQMAFTNSEGVLEKLRS